MAIELNGRSSLNPLASKTGPKLRTLFRAGAVVFSLLLLCLILRVLGDKLYDFPPNPNLNSLPKESAIVCLAGGKFRIETAFNLFADGRGEQLVIIGAGPKSSVLSLAKAHAPSAAMRISADRWEEVGVETESRNTIENSYAVHRYVQQNPQIKNLILVTSGYHMRRALYMLSRQLPPNILVIPYTPPQEVIDGKNWWRSKVGVEVTFAETAKFIMARLLIPQLGYF